MPAGRKRHVSVCCVILRHHAYACLPTPTHIHTHAQEYLNQYDEIPFRVLRFLFTEINYGGRVTDDKDRRLINNLISTFCGEDVLSDGYSFSPSGKCSPMAIASHPVISALRWL